ncbi:ATP-grasp fold amidoligase family protein, partial [Prevotella intermedia]|uniref:ATP-grasp fold amidoligase family protein n=1 Tax=Prevotella intermedia TaxID=28131 RepID=UPI000BE7263F
PYIALLCYDRYNDINGHSTATKDLYCLEPWQPKRDFLAKHESTPKYKFIPKPNCLDEVLKIAKDLTKDFPVVRADFYIIKDKPYFGELTFTPAGGLNYSYSDLAQIEMGKMIKL